MSLFALYFTPETVDVVGDSWQFDVFHDYVGTAPKIYVNAVSGIGFCHQGVVQICDRVKMWLEGRAGQAIETIEDVARDAPTLIRLYTEKFNAQLSGDDRHEAFIFWGPDKTGALRLYYITSFEGFKAIERKPGVYTLPMTGDTFPTTVDKPAEYLSQVVDALLKFCSPQIGHPAGGGPLVHLHQNGTEITMRKCGALPEWNEGDAEDVEAPEAYGDVEPLWSSFGQYKAFVADCYVKRRAREFPNMSRVERRRYAKEAEKQAALSRDIWEEVRHTVVDQHRHAQTVLAWVEQVGAPTH